MSWVLVGQVNRVLESLTEILLVAKDQRFLGRESQSKY